MYGTKQPAPVRYGGKTGKRLRRLNRWQESRKGKMLSAEQLIIVAYCHDGSILCRECGEGTPECEMGEALSAYEAEGVRGR